MSTHPHILNNGADVLAYTEQHSGGNGYREHGIALCHWGESLQPWVTWIVYRDNDGNWAAESGHYHENRVDAVADYRQRGGL